jgi:hypothetical protein
MALIKINLQYNSPFLNISNLLPRQGENVIAIGNPRKLGWSVSNGIVSGIREVYNNLWVQFTAPVSKGSSGGALLNINGEVIGMVTRLWEEEGQNLNLAVASTVLNQFLSSAINKTARELPKKAPTPPKKVQDFETKFVRNDDGYEIYLYTSEIEYDRRTGIAKFITFWLPKEKSKNIMRKDPEFHIPLGEEPDLCILFYNVNFKNNTYLHLRTINFSDKGNVIRDYIKPSNEIVWRTPKKGSRIESLMKEVKKYLRI